jgi:hypothetical protein
MALSHSAVAHLWANQSKDRASGGHVFFEGPRIYSYGHHFCMGRILPSGAVVLATRGYSNSTSKHKSYANRAVSHLTRVYCHDPDMSAADNRALVVREVANLLSAAGAPRTRESTNVKRRAEALHLAEQFNAYLAELPKGEQRGVKPIDVSKLQGVVEELRKQLEKERQQHMERRRRQAEEAKEDLEKWRRGEATRLGLYHLPVALRLSKDGKQVETSHGAEVPVSRAKRLWNYIRDVKANGIPANASKPYGAGINLGHFTLNEIREDGSIRAGCHNIAYPEIENIAKQLGLLEEAVH